MTQEFIEFKALRMQQPIGEFYIGVLPASAITKIATASIRQLEKSDGENELDKYTGIQRKLSPDRQKEIRKYVNTVDATFPTSIIISVRQENTLWDEKTNTLRLIATEETPISEIAKIIDGQHRIDGFRGLKEGINFDVNVSIFVGIDIAAQATIFATVNLAQTKVNRSLVYDLYEYEKNRSPQKTAHDVAVTLDQLPDSPFYHRIKRLGKRTDGRDNEPLTQAGIVEPILDYITSDPYRDRDSIIRKILTGKREEDPSKRIFYNLFWEEKDADIAKILLNYFKAVQRKWSGAWDDFDTRGNILPKTNGYRGLIRFLKPTYLSIVGDNIGRVATQEEFFQVIDRSTLRSENFNILLFPPGTAGESKLFNLLNDEIFKGIEPNLTP